MRLFKFIRRIKMTEKIEQKIEAFWVNATSDDVARVMRGETVEARFRDETDEAWGSCLTLIGWVNEPIHQWRSAGAGGRWNFCQVYREPSWWLNKPDPGPGWRLLDRFPDEEPKPGDECFGVSGEWGPSCQTKGGGHQASGIWYRRRIEPVAPEPRPVLTDWQCREGDTYRHPNGLRLAVTPKGFEVTP
jgi:hypothetical protein